MLFTSPVFFLFFGPVALLTFYVAKRFSLDKTHLIVFSMAFYSYWDPRLLPMLLIAIGVTWSVAVIALQSRWRKLFLVAGIVFNIALLAFFKYVNFLTGTLAQFGLTEPRHWNVILPLAISFFTFHQISYLADVYAERAGYYKLQDYALYVLFFPHLIAGPIVRHNEFIYQLPENLGKPVSFELIGRGLTLFVLGFAKKVWLADPLGKIVDPLFSTAQHTALGPFEAWAATLSFALQIYFDFSGYTDMAIGLSLMFGYRLPQNFDAPYRALSIIDFWRRWHMTLSRFLRDYLYIPLGGSRHGEVRRVFALMTTMLLGGLWHGANWTFVIWGGLHGLALAVNHSFREKKLRIAAVPAWLLTFVFVAVCFVIFRANTLGQAWHVIGGLVAVGQHQSVRLHDLGLIAIALAVATVGPTNHQITFERVRPLIWAAAALAVGFAGSVILVVGSENYAPFIYFQF